MKSRQQILYGGLWLVAIGLGMAALLRHSYTPGSEGAGAPPHWPAKSSIPLTLGKRTLLMFIHPKCPCTRASMRELAILMAHCQDQAAARVIVVRPEGADENWIRTDLCQSAASIPGVTVEVDQGGQEAQWFHATTSGQVVLYSPDGRLLFSGGITGSRGHEGDNAGLLGAMEILHGNQVTQGRTPVFGCPLLGAESKCTLTNLCTQ